MDVRVGVIPPLAADQWAGADLCRLVHFPRAVEELGFDSIWANDSLLRPRIEALTFLSAAAAVTERITLGTAALQPVLRRPVQTAQVPASIDRLRHGRVVVAVGAGFPGVSEFKYAASQAPWRRRFDPLDDTVALWRQLWKARSRTHFTGRCCISTTFRAASRRPPLTGRRCGSRAIRRARERGQEGSTTAGCRIRRCRKAFRLAG